MTASDSQAPPFSCRFTPALAEVMASLDCTLALSTYQAGKFIMLSPKLDGTGFWQFPRTFPKPMGVAVGANRIAVATASSVVVLENSPNLAAHYRPKPGTYDSLFLPRAHFVTGHIDIHDLAFAPDGPGLIAVNTLFSCLCRIDGTHSFVPTWQPPFISSLEPADNCHLNGMALDAEGRPSLVTALGRSDVAEGWRANLDRGGVLIDVVTGECVASELPMPHSPRIYDEQYFLLLSATGELVKLDPNSGGQETVAKLPGFARGLARCGDYLFAGISRLRVGHKFGHLPVAKMKPFCGVVAVHLPTGAIVGSLEFMNSCEEIYDVQTVCGLGRPAIVRQDDPFAVECLTIPGRTFLSAPE